MGRCGRYNRSGNALTFITEGDKDRIRILRGVMVQSGAELPKSVLNLTKPDLNDKKRVKYQKVEREELQTKVPKRELVATETVSYTFIFHKIENSETRRFLAGLGLNDFFCTANFISF